MIRFRSAAFFRWFLLSFTLVLWVGVTSCMHWSEPDSGVETVLDEKQPDKIRVTTADLQVIELQSPTIESDTLVGFGFPGEKLGAAQQMKIPLADVKQVEIRSTNAVATVLVLAGATVVLAAVISAAASSGGGSSGGSGGTTYGGTTYNDGSDTNMASCPAIYSWDGETWRLDSGTFGGAFLEPLARTDVDNLVFARAEDGLVRLRLSNDLSETDYVDALRLRVVDHPIGTEPIPDASASGAIHLVGELAAPLSARDDRGRDALSAVQAADGWGWESSPSGRDTTVAADVRDGLELEFTRPEGSRQATLVLDANNTPWAAALMQQFVAAHGSETDAWYASMNANPIAAFTLGQRMAREGFLQVSVRTERGWEPQGLVWEAGPEVAKRQAIRLDLSDVDGETVEVRLESIPLFWNIDRVAVDFSRVGESVPAPDVLEVEAMSARWVADGRDVAAMLSAVDGTYLVLEKGEAAELEFLVPPVPEGSARSYLAASTGWYRIHAAVSDAEPDEAVLRIEQEYQPGALSRIAVGQLNDALAVLANRASHDRPEMVEASR